MKKCVRNTKSSLLVLFIVMVLVLFDMTAFGAMRDWQIEVSNNELAADIENAPLGVVLEEIQRRAGIEFFLDKDQSDRTITVKFTSLPVERALARILSRLSYAILYGGDERILSIMIFGTNKTSPMRNTNLSADELYQERKMSTETLTESRSGTQVSTGGHGIIVESTSIAGEMIIEPASGEEMKIFTSSDFDMLINEPPNGEEMGIDPPYDEDIVVF